MFRGTTMKKDKALFPDLGIFSKIGYLAALIILFISWKMKFIVSDQWALYALGILLGTRVIVLISNDGIDGLFKLYDKFCQDK